MTEPGMAVPAAVERVARALATSQGADPDCLAFVGHPQHGPRNTIMVPGTESWQSPRPLWTFYVGDARAAIEAMREPSEEMMRYAEGYCDFILPDGVGENTPAGRVAEFTNGYKLAIAVALGEWPRDSGKRAALGKGEG